MKDGFLAQRGLLAEADIAEAKAVLERAQADDIETIRVVFTDPHGILRGKTVTREALGAVFTSGLRVPSTLLLKDIAHRTVFPVWSADGTAPFQGASDLLLVPVPGSYRTLPWSPHSAQMHCRLATTDGGPVPMCSRAILERAVEALAAQGLVATMGLEVEFQVFEPEGPTAVNAGGQYLTDGRYGEAEALLDQIRRAAQAMGLPVQSVEIEMGPGQFEFTFAPSDPIAIAEMAVTFRGLVKDVCQRAGLVASFMAKPKVPGAVGNGWHIHQSVQDAEGRNLFEPEGAGVTDAAGHWIAGLLHHAAAACLATNPTVNSYKRFGAFQLAPNQIGWGADNRGAMIRTIMAKGSAASRVENRVADSSANPYLALAFQIFAGLEGLTSARVPPAPLEDPYGAEADVLPGSLRDAIDGFEGSAMYRAALGREVADYLIHLKRAEWDAYMAAISDWEQATYFDAL